MAHSYERSIEEELTCNVCFELFVDPNTPKELNCPHIICELCAVKIIALGAIECPECRVVTKLSEDGIAALRTNFRVRNLAEKHQKHLESQQQPFDLLPESNEPCNLPVCHQHEGMKLRYICEPCNETVCHECVSINHCDQTKHDVKHMKYAQKYQLKNVETKLKEIETVMFECQAAFQELDICEVNIWRAISVEDMIIDAAALEVKMKLDIQCIALQNELRKKHDSKLQKIQREKSILQRRIMDLQQVLSDAESDVKGKQINLEQTKMLLENLKIIRERQNSMILVQYQPDDIKFEVNQPDFGNLKYKERNDTTKVIMLRHLPRKLKLNSEITGFHHGLSSIASNKNGTVIATCEWISSQVNIHFKQSICRFKKVLSLTVPDDYGSNANFVAIAADGRIYVARDRGIHMYLESGEYQTVLHVCSEHESSCIFLHFRCITTTQDGRIIAANYANSELIVLKPDGDIVKSIPTKYRPSYIVIINDTQVAVCYLGQRLVHIIDLGTGQETFSIIPNCAYPLALCYDEESNSLLVSGRDRADKGNYVIEQYSLTTGYFIACIAQGLRSPNAITFAGNNTLLACHDNRVKVYSALD